MHKIENLFTHQLVSTLFIKLSEMLKRMYNDHNMIEEYNCSEFDWELDEDEDGITISLGIFKGYNFIAKWNGEYDLSKAIVTVNVENYDLSKGNELDAFVEMEQICFNHIEKKIEERNNSEFFVSPMQMPSRD